MPRETKRKRKSSENLKKAREAQKKMKESSLAAATPSSTSTTESPSLGAQRSHEDPSILVSTQEVQPQAPFDSQSTPVDQTELSEAPRDDLQSHDDQPTPEDTLTSQENEPLSTTSLELETDKKASPRSPTEIFEDFCEDWLTELDRDDKKSLGIFLCHNLVKHFGMNNTEAAQLAACMIGKSDRSVRQWRTNVLNNNGILPESKQGKYQRNGVLWNNEELNEKARQYIRVNSSVKGQPNMTCASFCKWVNKTLLPNSTLEPGYPRSVSVETVRRWLHELGFEVITPRKGIFIDGHERQDVVDYRKQFLRRMVKIGFIHFTNAPTENAQQAIPTDIDPPTAERRSKTVVFFHDESTFNSNDDQSLKWGLEGEKIMKQKSKGAGIMVSDYIDEHNGFLALTEDEYRAAKDANPAIKPYAREFLEYGESKEGYWTRDKFMEQMERAVAIAEIKYPKSNGWRHVWVFDHSSCHAAMADDALDVNKMNVGPGGKQRIMRDTQYDGKLQRMYFMCGGEKVAKGMKVVLEERGISTVGKNGNWMRDTLKKHPDFKHEMSMIEHFLTSKGHIPVFLPKFHPELNPIERVWAQLKRYTKAHCNYSIHSLRKNIPAAYDTVTLENIQNHFRKIKHFMFGYLEGMVPGKELDETLKKYKNAVKSHRRIGVNE